MLHIIALKNVKTSQYSQLLNTMVQIDAIMVSIYGFLIKKLLNLIFTDKDIMELLKTTKMDLKNNNQAFHIFFYLDLNSLMYISQKLLIFLLQYNRKGLTMPLFQV